MPSLRRCGLRLTAAGVGLLVSCFRTRHDLRPVGGMGRQHAMIAQVEAGPQTLALGPAISAVSLFVDSEQRWSPKFGQRVKLDSDLTWKDMES